MRSRSKAGDASEYFIEVEKFGLTVIVFSITLCLDSCAGQGPEIVAEKERGILHF